MLFKYTSGKRSEIGRRHEMTLSDFVQLIPKLHTY